MNFWPDCQWQMLTGNFALIHLQQSEVFAWNSSELQSSNNCIATRRPISLRFHCCSPPTHWLGPFSPRRERVDLRQTRVEKLSLTAGAPSQRRLWYTQYIRSRHLVWSPCSSTSALSWRCKLCTSAPQATPLEWHRSSCPIQARSRVKHIRSCYRPASDVHLGRAARRERERWIFLTSWNIKLEIEKITIKEHSKRQRITIFKGKLTKEKK